MIAFNDLGALSLPVLSTDILAASRDGVNAKRFTVADLFNAPAITGNATATTQSTGNSSTRIATTAYVKANLANYGSLAANNSWASGQKFGDGVGDTDIQIVGPAGSRRSIIFKTGTHERAMIEVGNGAEAGADAGSTLAFYTFDDSDVGSVFMVVPRDTAQPVFFGRAIETVGDIIGGAGLTLNAPLSISTTQVLDTRQTGWSPPTGTLSRAAFDGSSATLANTREALAALLTDLHTHGMIGA